ncbi:MAG TPA: hypothetical protein VEU30_00720 [Thermoanaerobaculia bacterium]|nr:hypothetical protein [Thermoanaerobaculia bacterium]
MRYGLLLGMLLVSASALADADMELVSMTADKTQVVTGERFRVTGRVRNNGPDAARNVRVTLSQELTGYFLDVSAPAGWSCEDPRFASSVTCSIASVAAGAESEFAATSLAPAAPATRHALGGLVFHDDRDPQPGNISRGVNVAVTAASTIADLTLAGESELQVRPGETKTLRFAAGNNGPDEARDVAVIFAFVGAPPVSLSGAGSGWRCESTAGARMVCTRTRLAANATAPIDLTLTATSFDVVLSLHVATIAEMSRDPQAQTHHTVVFVGAAENWRRRLIPTAADRIAGANGSLWRTDVRMLIRADQRIEIRPHACDFSPIPECYIGAAPLRAELDAREYGFVLEDVRGAGHFLYVRSADFDDLRVNARTYDAARQTETAGAELPIPRDDEFTSTSIDLLGIPTAPHYRHTLRIYDFDGRNGTRAIVRVFAGAESEPRATHEVVLAREDPSRVTTALLPLQPAFAQFTLADLMPLGGVETVRIEITPADPGARLWSFVSIINNDTHHVMTVSPQ